MAQSAVLAANWALRLIGSRKVLTTLSDTTVEGVACNAMIDDTKMSLLRMHPWNFAIKRKVLLPPASFAISNVTWVSSQIIEVTHATVTYALGSYVTIEGVLGATLANGTFEVQTATVGGVTTRLTVPLATTSVLLGTYTSGGTIRQSPAFDYTYLYTLPTDCLRVLDLTTDGEPYRVEEGKILADSSSILIRYIKDVTDYATMDVLFYRCLAHLLAYDLCDFITASDGKKNELHVYLYGGQSKKGILPQARFVDATEDSQQIFEANEWILSRGGAPAAAMGDPVA